MDSINIYLDKVKSLVGIKNSQTKTGSNLGDKDVIDIKEAFSVEKIDIEPIIRKILLLDPQFPNNLLISQHGHKYNELEFFESNLDSSISNETRSHSFFERFKQTKTRLGTVNLQNILINPSTDVKLLQQRQQTIQYFLGHPKLNDIIAQIEQLAMVEKEVLALLVPDSDEMLEIYKVIYFQMKPLQFLNYNETILKVFYFFVMLFTPLYGVLSPLIMLFAPFLFLKYFLKLPITFSGYLSLFKSLVFGGTGITSIISKALSLIFASPSNLCGGGEKAFAFSMKDIAIWLVQHIIAIINSKVGSYLYIAFIAVTYCYGIYNSFHVSKTYNKIINVIHAKLNKLAVWARYAVGFYMEYGNVVGVLNKQLCNRINNLLQNPTMQLLLNHKTFTCEPGLFTNKGIILKVFKEFLDTKEKQTEFLEPLSEFIAHVDTWSSLARWISTGKDTYRSFCNYIENSYRPVVDGLDVWNICCDKPVCNDAYLGDVTKGEEFTDVTSKGETETEKSLESQEKVNPVTPNVHSPNNMLITGPNSSGKSTYIKSIIESIILAQTVGVVPAKKFNITPFHNITTYLNIPDCQGKESLFQAEMNRCYQQLEMLKKCEADNQFTFNIMDEIFVSTNYQEGMSGFYAVIKKLCTYEKCLNIITTHFDILARMDEIPVKKQYFDIDINDETDEIYKDFKVKSGVSKKHMALKLLKRKGFDSEIIKDAEYLYNKLTAENQEKENKDVQNVKDDAKDDVSKDVTKDVVSKDVTAKDDVTDDVTDDANDDIMECEGDNQKISDSEKITTI